jgi:hypothetical protein
MSVELAGGSGYMSGSKPLSESAIKVLPEVFQGFIRECQEEVEPVLVRFGLSRLEVVSHLPGCAVRYHGGGIRLIMNYEYGSPPWATLEVSLQSGWKQFSLHRLMKSMCPNLARKAVGKGRSEEEARLQAVKAISEFIPKIAAIFRGDLSLLGVT